MQLLLDTHIFLWCITDDRRLSSTARSLIINAREVFVSTVSLWEISIKIKLGKLQGRIEDLKGAIEKSGYRELSLTADHICEIADLPDIHRDPFDRALVAQAIYEPLRLLTADAKLQEYSKLIEIV